MNIKVVDENEYPIENATVGTCHNEMMGQRVLVDGEWKSAGWAITKTDGHGRTNHDVRVGTMIRVRKAEPNGVDYSFVEIICDDFIGHEFEKSGIQIRMEWVTVGS